MVENGIRHLRVLIANERRDRLELLANVVIGLGHEVIAREVDVKEVGAVTARIVAAYHQLVRSQGRPIQPAAPSREIVAGYRV